MIDHTSLRGLVPAIVTPFRDNFALDEQALRSYIRWLASQRIVALAVNTEAGETTFLLPEERNRVIEIVAGEVGDRLPIVAGISAYYTGDAVQQAREARQRGASALLAFPVPFSRGVPNDILIGHFAAMSEASGLPLVLFQRRPSMGGMIYSSEFLHEIARRAPIIGMKEAAFDPVVFVNVVNALRAAPRPITLLTGNDLFIPESFLFGADGGLLALSTLAIDLQADILEVARAGDRDRTLELGARLQPLADTVFGDPVGKARARLKVALHHLGILPNTVVRPPQSPVTPSEVDAICGTLALVEPAHR